MKYFVLQIDHVANLPTLHNVEEHEVDDIVGLTEETFTSFPIEGESRCRELEDNQYRYLIYSQKDRNELFAFVNETIYACEAFFDDLEDPSNPTDEKIYKQVGVELDEWIKIRSQLED